MAPGRVEEPSDSDSDVEFEDIPITHAAREEDTDISLVLRHQEWIPRLSLPPQRAQPLPSGSTAETQLRGQISTGIERVTYRKTKADMGMDAPNTPATHRKYESFAELADDVDGLIDTIWASATRELYVPPRHAVCIIKTLLIPISGYPNRSTHHPSRTNPNFTYILPVLG